MPVYSITNNSYYTESYSQNSRRFYDKNDFGGVKSLYIFRSVL